MNEPPSTSTSAFRTPARRQWWQRLRELFRRRPSIDVVETLLAVPLRTPSSVRVLRRAFVLGAERSHGAITPTHLWTALLLDVEVQALLAGIEVAPLLSTAFAALDRVPATDDGTRLADPALVATIGAIAAQHDPRTFFTSSRWFALWFRTDEERRLELTAAGFDEMACLATFAAPIVFEPAGVDDEHVIVRMHNDDFTSQEFVVAALREVCGLDDEAAVGEMYRIHDRRSAIVWRGSREQALDVVARIEGAARDERQPLRLTIERDTELTSSDRARPSS